MIKAIFLDRDGVINLKALPHEYIEKAEDFIFLPKVIEALRILNEKGYKLFIVTNQRGISRGKMNIANLEKIHNKMLSELSNNGVEIMDIRFCPHGEGECNCRKPKTGMVDDLRDLYNINMESSWMIGDSLSDMELGRNIGIKTIFIGEMKELSSLCDYYFFDLFLASKFIK